MPATVEFHPSAARELKTAYHWYYDRHPASARAFLAELDIAIERIASSPDRWPLLAHDIRRYLLKRFPFSIVYRVKTGEVQIVAVAHARRRPGYWEVR